MRFIFLAALLWPAFASANETEWVHLGAPPKGLTFIELKSQSAVAPVILAGTLNPPSLSVNGQNVKLKSQAETIQPGLRINGKSFEAADTMGRFFVQLDGADAAIEELSVELGGALPKTALIPINRIFLEAPILIKQVLPADTVGKTFEFKLTGQIRGKFNLKVSGQEIKAGADGTVVVPLSLPEGSSTVTVEFQRQGVPKKILNLPLTVTKSEFVPGHPILSFERPLEKSGALHFKGVINALASLSAFGKDIEAKKDGSFEWAFYPPATKGTIQFRVFRPKDGPAAFEYEYDCPACRPEELKPAARQSLTVHLTEMSSFVFTGDALPGKVLTSFSHYLPLDHMRVNYRRAFSENAFWSVGAGYAAKYDGDPGDNYAIKIEKLLSYDLGVAYRLTPHALGEAAFRYQEGSAVAKNFSASTGHLISLGLTLAIEGDFPLSEGWSYSPRFTLASSGLALQSETPASWIFVSLQLLGLTHNF